jgi:hypothetical protein
MALARFFDKAAQSASAILEGFDYDAFKEALSRGRIAVAFDSQAASSSEACWTLELLVNFFARLYPQLSLIRHDDSANAIALEQILKEVATGINPVLQVEQGMANSDALDPVSIVVSVGASSVPEGRGRNVIYVGSNQWEVRLGGCEPWGAGTSDLPFAAGAAACLAAAAVFRAIFSDQLKQSGLSPIPLPERFEPSLRLSLLTLTTAEKCVPEPENKESVAADSQFTHHVDIGEVFLVGVGAIGNATVWALSRAKFLMGKLWLIDGELVELSNIQRYVLTDDQSEGVSKVDVAAAEFPERPIGGESTGAPDVGEGLSVTTVGSTWNTFVDRNGDYRFDRVLLALDSAEDRIAAQASLPRWIANAWTQVDNLGVSRHFNFERYACVACLYIPVGQTKSREHLVCEALRVDNDVDRMEVKTLLHLGRSVGEDFIRRTATRLAINDAELMRFADGPLEAFYVEAVCGGLFLRLGADVGPVRSAIVPMAFQSALAGILLATEAVISALDRRTSDFAGRTEIDLRRPLGGRLNSPTAKSTLGNCICQDEVYLEAYRAKYSQK